MTKMNNPAEKSIPHSELRRLGNVPPSAYALPDDGRQQRHLCHARRELMRELSDFANPDGTSVCPSSARLGRRLGCSEKTVDRLMADLVRLGAISNHGWHPTFKTRMRSINLAWISANSPGTSSPDSPGTSSDDQGNLHGSAGTSSIPPGTSSDFTRVILEPATREEVPLPSIQPGLPENQNHQPTSAKTGWRELLSSNQATMG